MTQRLPIPGEDNGTWGNILNGFLEVSLNGNGTLNTSALQQAGGVTSVNTITPSNGNVTLTAANVGAITQSNADGRYIAQSQLGAASGVATLNGSSQLTTSQLPGSVLTSSGGTLTGDLILPGNPAESTGAIPESYTFTQIFDTVDVRKIPGVDPTGVTDSTTALLAALTSDSQSVFDFGGSENTYLISSTDSVPFTVIRDGLHLTGNGARINVNYPWDGTANGVCIYGNDLVVEGLKFINTNPLTAYQRDQLSPGHHSNGDIVRFGGQISPLTYSAGVTVQDCEFWGAYTSGLNVQNAYRVQISRVHIQACNGNGIWAADILDYLHISDVSVLNTGDDMIAIIADSHGPTVDIQIDSPILQNGQGNGIDIAGGVWAKVNNPIINSTFGAGILVTSEFSGLTPSYSTTINNPIIRNPGAWYGANGVGVNGTRGAWTPSTSYNVGDYVQYHGTVQVCTAAYTSGSSFGSLIPGENPNWSEFTGFIHSTADSGGNAGILINGSYDVTVDGAELYNCASHAIEATGTISSQLVSGAVTLGTSSSSPTNLSLSALSSGMPTSSDHAVIYDPTTGESAVFAFTGVSSTTLQNCYAISPGAFTSFSSSSYVNVPIAKITIRSAKIRGAAGRALYFAPATTVISGGVDYLQFFDVDIEDIDFIDCAGGVTISQMSDVTVGKVKARSYSLGGGTGYRAIDYSNVRNFLLTQLPNADNDDAAGVAILGHGTNVNTQGPGMNYRGAWAASTIYNQNDVVLENGTIWAAIASFTSASSFNASNWTQLAPVQGPKTWNVIGNRSTAYTMNSWDSVGVSGASITITTPASPAVGDQVMIWRDGLTASSAITVAANSGQTINGNSSFTMIGANTSVYSNLAILTYLVSGTWVVSSAVGADANTGLYTGGSLVAGGAFQINGAFRTHVVTKTTTYATGSGDQWINATSGTWTLTLTTATAGQVLFVTNTGSGVITLAPSSGTLSGPSSLAAGVAVMVVCDGTNWTTVAANGSGLSSVGVGLELDNGAPQFAIGNVTTVTATNAAWSIPTGSRTLRITAVGGGGGGGGAGSAASTQTQSGGGGGAAGAASTQVVSVGSNTTLDITIGAGGAGGTGGAAGGNTGIAGGNGGSTTVTATGISVTGNGGPRGAVSAASTTSTIAGGAYGGGPAITTTVPAGGCGGISGSGSSSGGGPLFYSAGGGGGGGAASATLGGTAGAPGTALVGGNPGTAGGSGTSNGATGTNATALSAGGGGGGGGAAGTGAGGNGGNGASGFVIVEVIG